MLKNEKIHKLWIKGIVGRSDVLQSFLSTDICSGARAIWFVFLVPTLLSWSTFVCPIRLWKSWRAGQRVYFKCEDLHRNSVCDVAAMFLYTVICKWCVRPAHFVPTRTTTRSGSHLWSRTIPKINKPLYKSSNDIKLVFMISPQSFLARKYLSFICLWFTVHYSVVFMQFFFYFAIISVCFIPVTKSSGHQRCTTYPFNLNWIFKCKNVFGFYQLLLCMYMHEEA